MDFRSRTTSPLPETQILYEWRDLSMEKAKLENKNEKLQTEIRDLKEKIKKLEDRNERLANQSDCCVIS